MEFWTQEKIQSILEDDCRFINFPDNWSSNGLKIWHTDFEFGNMAFMRADGEKRGILPKYLPDIIEKVSAIITTNADEFKCFKKPIIEISCYPDDVILMFAKYIRKFFNGKVIDITGSSGKSTTTKIIYDVLSKFGASANLGQANTSWGIAWNMTNFNLDDKYWVIETSLGGGIVRNSLITVPHYAIITNIAPVHLGKGQDLSDIAKEKANIFTSMKSNDYAILYKDMAHYDIVREKALQRELNIITFGENDCDIKIVCDDVCSFIIDGQIYSLKNIVPKHIMLDMAAAIAVAKIENINLDFVFDVLNEFKTLSGRGETFSGKINDNTFVTVVDESYNANPLSMKAALEAFKNKEKDGSLLILGDMSEGGADTVSQHLNLESVIRSIKPERILFCGQNIKYLWNVLKTDYPTEWFCNSELLNKELLNWIKDGDNIFVKASNSVKLYKTVELLKSVMK